MKLSQIVKSPLTYIAVAVAIIAFAAGLFISARTPADITASGPKEVVIEAPVVYRNPDGTWPSPVPTTAPPAGQDDYDPILEPNATGIATMGKLLYLYDGGSIQLPPDVYVEDHIDIGSCANSLNCPEFPVLILARGNDRVAIDRHGEPRPNWSDSPEFNLGAFEFLSE